MYLKDVLNNYQGCHTLRLVGIFFLKFKLAFYKIKSSSYYFFFSVLDLYKLYFQPNHKLRLIKTNRMLTRLNLVTQISFLSQIVANLEIYNIKYFRFQKIIHCFKTHCIINNTFKLLI